MMSSYYCCQHNSVSSLKNRANKKEAGALFSQHDFITKPCLGHSLPATVLLCTCYPVHKMYFQWCILCTMTTLFQQGAGWAPAST